jgi:hypothetical protein
MFIEEFALVYGDVEDLFSFGCQICTYCDFSVETISNYFPEVVDIILHEYKTTSLIECV